MDFVNESGVSAGWTMGFTRDGRELVVVAIKATFTIPEPGEVPPLATEQLNLVEADQFSGTPGQSAPLHDSDFAHHKARCDVLLNGNAYAPGGRPATVFGVGIKAGSMSKILKVVGDRVWQGSPAGATASEPAPTSVIPVSYDRAFGGADVTRGEEGDIRTYLANPVGRGYGHYRDGIEEKPLPNTEEIGVAVVDPSGRYRPMAFGPIGRGWQPRVSFAGTYDQKWLDERSPFWPDDFDYQYFQSAPADQQIPYPAGGEQIVLKNLTPRGHAEWRLPDLAMPVLFIPHRARARQVAAAADTILIEPDFHRFSITWRATYLARKSCFELMRIVAGKTARAWYGRQRFGSKPYYANLAELIRARRR